MLASSNSDRPYTRCMMAARARHATTAGTTGSWAGTPAHRPEDQLIGQDANSYFPRGPPLFDAELAEPIAITF